MRAAVPDKTGRGGERDREGVRKEYVTVRKTEKELRETEREGE